MLTIGTSIFTLLALTPSFATTKPVLEATRLKRAGLRFVTTVQQDIRYAALAVLDIVKVILSLVLLNSANYLSM